VKKKRKAATALLMVGGRTPVCAWWCCVGRPADEGRKRADVANVVVARLLAEAAHPHVFDHAAPAAR
jgi:hypothetical protein